MSGRHKTKPSPARRHRKAEAAVAKTPAPPTPEQLQQLKQRAVRHAVAEMQAAINQAIAEEREEWLRVTGRPMPMTTDPDGQTAIDKLLIEARVAGLTDQEISDPDAPQRGYAQVLTALTARKILRDEKVADDITVQVAVAERLASASEPTVSEGTRIANSLTTESRKALAALDEWGANSLGNKMTRDDIQDRTHLSRSSVRNVMERELPRQVVDLVTTKTGPGGGVWLTPEGAVVASTIDKKILPREDHSAAGKKY